MSQESIIEFPVPISSKNPKGIVEIPLEQSGINIQRDPKFLIPSYWRQQTGKMGQWSTRDYSIDIDKQHAKKLIELNFRIAGYENRKQRFIDVVLAYNDLYTRTGIMEGKDYDIEELGLGGKQIQLKFISLAKALGLVTEQGKKTKAERPPSRTEKDLDKFQEQPLIKDFYEFTEHKSDTNDWQTTTRNLKRALNLLDLTPEDFRHANDEIDPTALNSPKGKRLWEQWFTKRAKTPTWTAIDGSKWSLDAWAKDNKRPHISGAGNKTTKEGDKIGQEKASIAKTDSESQLKQFKIVIKHFGEALDIVKGGKRVGSWFEMPKVELKYPALKMSAKQITKCIECLSEKKSKDQLIFEEESIYGTIDKSNLESDDIIEDKTPGLSNLPRTQIKKTRYETTQEDWTDAHLYLMGGLDVGWRASEGLTATFGNPQFWLRDKDVPENKQTGVWTESLGEGNKTVMKIKFLTRKTWGMKDKKTGLERTTYTEMLLTQETRKLYESRIQHIQEGIDAIDEGKLSSKQIFEKYGIEQYKELNGRKVPNYDHTLIGHDGKYVSINSVKYPSRHKLTLSQKREKEAKGETIQSMKVIHKAQEKLHAIMREALRASGVDLSETDENGNLIGDYWLRHSLHAWRHVFAQKWLIQSHWNYAFVAKKGHWADTKILEDAYGAVGSKQHMIDSFSAAKYTLEEAEKDAKQEFSQKVMEDIPS